MGKVNALWIVDSGATRNITAIKSSRKSYNKEAISARGRGARDCPAHSGAHTHRAALSSPSAPLLASTRLSCYRAAARCAPRCCIVVRRGPRCFAATLLRPTTVRTRWSCPRSVGSRRWRLGDVRGRLRATSARDHGQARALAFLSVLLGRGRRRTAALPPASPLADAAETENTPWGLRAPFFPISTSASPRRSRRGASSWICYSAARTAQGAPTGTLYAPRRFALTDDDSLRASPPPSDDVPSRGLPRRHAPPPPTARSRQGWDGPPSPPPHWPSPRPSPPRLPLHRVHGPGWPEERAAEHREWTRK